MLRQMFLCSQESFEYLLIFFFVKSYLSNTDSFLSYHFEQIKTFTYSHICCHYLPLIFYKKYVYLRVSNSVTFKSRRHVIKERMLIYLILSHSQFSISMYLKVERFKIQQKKSTNTRKLYQFYNLIQKKIFNFFMQAHSTQQLRKRCLIPSKTSSNNFIITAFQIQPSYNQQFSKKLLTPKTKNKGPKFLLFNQEKENGQFQQLNIQDEVNLLSTQSEFNINSIEQFILGPVSKDQCKRYVYNVYRGVIYSQLKLKSPTEDFVKSRKVYLSEPTGSEKKFLLLDLDQTLIYAQKGIEVSGKTSYKFFYRPHLFSFLERMGQLFEVYVFSAAQRSYAEGVVKKFNRGRLLIRDFLHRDHCLETRKGHFLKDLRIVGNRELKDIVIIDNLVESFGFQLNNGVPILQFKGSAEDRQLLRIIPLMERISQAEDVRTVLKESFRLEEVGKINRKMLETYFSTE